MRRPTLFLAVLALVSLQFGSTAHADETSTAMADAAKRFLAALDDKQKVQASFPFDSPERFNWHWIPRERKGLPIKAMTPEQRALAFGLLDTGLSTKGMLKATTIMSLEEILRLKEHGTGPVRDPELYFVSIFGNPAENAEWGWRIEGHHLALNYTLRDNRVVSATPFMFGSNPATVKEGGRKGLRNLASIEEPANQLLLSLNDEQRRLAIVSSEVPEVTTTPNSAEAPASTPLGISSSKLNDDQRKTLHQFLAAYYENFPQSIRTAFHEQISRGEHEFYFAWYGPPDPAQPHAFRVQGPILLIDFNDKQDGANHIHTFYRSIGGDFGLTSSR